MQYAECELVCWYCAGVCCITDRGNLCAGFQEEEDEEGGGAEAENAWPRAE